MEIKGLYEGIRRELEKVIVGQKEAITSMIIGLLCDGHILFEGVPGTAKTLLVRGLGHTLDLSFKRVQFTPDLMPSDIIGTNVFDIKSSTFSLKRGPIFTNLLLADEVNRTPAKTQSALLEAMQERIVTIDGVDYPVPRPFIVFATQNPIEHEGTYPLPEAQLDRFLLKVVIDYPNDDEEKIILLRHHEGFDPFHLDLAGIERVGDSSSLQEAKGQIKGIVVDEAILEYIQAIIKATRSSTDILLGASPRAGVHLLLTSKARAAISGRDFVTPDDVKRMSYPVLRHRLILQPEVEIEGVGADDLIQRILNQVKVPR